MEEELFTHSLFPNSTVILSFVDLRLAQLYVSLVLSRPSVNYFKNSLKSLVMMLWKAPGIKLPSYRSKGFKVTWWRCAQDWRTSSDLWRPIARKSYFGMVPNQNNYSNVMFCQSWAETKVPRNVLVRECGDLGGGRLTWWGVKAIPRFVELIKPIVAPLISQLCQSATYLDPHLLLLVVK